MASRVAVPYTRPHRILRLLCRDGTILQFDSLMRKATVSCLNSGVMMRRRLLMRHLHFAMMVGRCTQLQRTFTVCCMNDGPIINVSLWSQNACVMTDHDNILEPQPFQHLF